MTHILALVGKDLRILARSRATLLAMVAYPIGLALLAALATGGAERSRVAYVDEARLPDTIAIGSTRLDYRALLDGVSRRVDLQRMEPGAARRALAAGDVVAVVTIPRTFVTDLRSTLRSPVVRLETRGGAAGERVQREVQALVYDVNNAVQRDLLQSNLGFLKLLVTGGTTTFLGRDITVLGLDRTAAIARELEAQASDPASRAKLDEILGFANDAQLALGFAEPTLRTVAHPVELETRRLTDRSILQGRAAALLAAAAIVLLGLPLGAGALASERADRTAVRLLRGLVTPLALVTAKTALVAFCGGLLALVALPAVALFLDVPPSRIPLAVGLAVVGAAATGALGAALGALVRDTSGAALVAALLAVPFLLAALVAAAQETPSLAVVGQLFPLAPLARGLEDALFRSGAGREALASGAQLVALGAAAFLVAWRRAPRLAE